LSGSSAFESVRNYSECEFFFPKCNQLPSKAFKRSLESFNAAFDVHGGQFRMAIIVPTLLLIFKDINNIYQQWCHISKIDLNDMKICYSKRKLYVS
jgi:hypothetical protein